MALCAETPLGAMFVTSVPYMDINVTNVVPAGS